MGGHGKNWGLVSERGFLDELGSYGSEMSRAELLKRYIEINRDNGRRERYGEHWWGQAVEYARQLLRKEKR